MLHESWLGLIIGNSRLHWVYVQGHNLSKVWHSEHLNIPVTPEVLFDNLSWFKQISIVIEQKLPVYLASVVPSQTALWQSYPYRKEITLKDIPLKALYPTMGIDRALAIYGAGEVYGYPSLVIDGGTALTFTGVDCSQTLVGGAILPGLRSQFKLLDEQTAALPLVELAAALPHRWATDTPDAIRSGIIHTLVAGIYSFIMDWLQYFPQSQIVLTGGDSKIIERYLQQQFPTLAQKIVLDEALLFRGLQQVVTN